MLFLVESNVETQETKSAIDQMYLKCTFQMNHEKLSDILEFITEICVVKNLNLT